MHKSKLEAPYRFTTPPPPRQPLHKSPSRMRMGVGGVCVGINATVSYVHVIIAHALRRFNFLRYHKLD